MSLCGTLAQISGNFPVKLRLVTSRDLEVIFETTCNPDQAVVGLVALDTTTDLRQGVNLLRIPRPLPASSFGAKDKV